jgi:hypothetical protein
MPQKTLIGLPASVHVGGFDSHVPVIAMAQHQGWNDALCHRQDSQQEDKRPAQQGLFHNAIGFLNPFKP